MAESKSSRVNTPVFSLNCRGLQDDAEIVQDYMEDTDAVVGAFMETKLYGKPPSFAAKWKWHGYKKSELLPTLGETDPRRGLGIAVNTEFCLGSEVVGGGQHTLWVYMPGAEEDLYVCATHIPVYGEAD